MTLTRLQRQVAQVFFALPEAEGFAVAGGAGLLARDLIDRRTRDLDLFGVPPVDVHAAAGALEAAADRQGWTSSRIREGPSFVRLTISDGEETLVVDLAADPATERATLTELGPTLHERDLAAGKLLALWHRLEARDYADVYRLARRFGPDALIEWATARDAGFAPALLVDALHGHARWSDEDLQVHGVAAGELRAFFDDWAQRLA